jgi:hypothetical protein
LDLKANAVDVTTGLSTKVDKITGKGLSSTDFTQAEKDKLTAITGINTGDQDLSGLATTIDLDLKANAVDVTTGLSTKVDKITGKGLSSTDFTQPEKDKLALILGINNNEPVNLSALATKAELENDYAKLDEENSFSEDQIFEGSINFRGDNESRINFSDVYNSSIRTYNYDGYPGGVLISTDEIIFLGKDEDDVEAFDGWSFDVVTGKLKFPGRKTEMFQEGSVFNIIGENDLYLSGGRENEEGEGKWGEIGISSYERLYLQINQDDQDDQEISAGISLNHEEENSPMNIEIYNSGNYWRFDPSGTLTLPNNSKISDDGQGLGINTEGAFFIFSGSMENEEESDENEEESDENEAEFFTGLYLDKEFGINFFISGEEGGASISINQAYEDDIHVNVNNLGYEWVFDSEGRLKFPNNTHISDSEGTFRIESPNALVFMGDLDNEDFGASIAISPDEWYDSEGDLDEDLETQGSIFITTLDLDDDIYNTWKFGKSGNLVFPDGTFFGEIEGDIGFETEENSDFLLVTSDGVDSFEWQFTNDGVFKLPDGGDIQDSNGNSVLGPNSFRFKSEVFYIDWQIKYDDPDGTTYSPDFGKGIEEGIEDGFLHKIDDDGDWENGFYLIFELEEVPLDPEKLTIYFNGIRIPRKLFLPDQDTPFLLEPEFSYRLDPDDDNPNKVSLDIFSSPNELLIFEFFGPTLTITIDYQY